jgi:hypothetical protein
MVCLAEPTALTAEQIVADDVTDAQGLGRPNEEAFNNSGLIAGRDCRDTLRRNCGWHAERGDRDVDCDKPRLTEGG